MDKFAHVEPDVGDAGDLSGQPDPVLSCREDPRIEELSKTYLADLASGVRNRFGGGPPDPEDVAQEAFRRVIERGDTASIKNLKGFLWRTARNLVLDTKKLGRTRSKYDLEVEEIYFPHGGDISTPETVVLAKEQLKAVNEILRQMPEKRRRALVLYRVEGLTLVEVARRLRLSRTAVSKHIAKAHSALSELYVEDVDG